MFSFGPGSPNSNVQDTKEKELIGIKVVADVLAPEFAVRSPLRHAETTDAVLELILNFQVTVSKNVSFKTTQRNGLKKDGTFSGFIFTLTIINLAVKPLKLREMGKA